VSYLEQAFADADRDIVIAVLERLLRLVDERLNVELVHFRSSSPPVLLGTSRAERPFYISCLLVIMDAA
jgi:hypothetical protein